MRRVTSFAAILHVYSSHISSFILQFQQKRSLTAHTEQAGLITMFLNLDKSVNCPQVFQSVRNML